eukprot:9568422-Karenia_brevis.AAC.1
MLTHGFSACSAKSIAAHVKEFISAVKRFVQFALSPHFHSLFHAPLCVSHRLLTYGFLSHLPHTSLFIGLSPRVQQILDHMMLQLHTPLSKDQLEAMDQGNLVLKVRRFAGHHSLNCRTLLVELSEALKEEALSSSVIVRHPQPTKHTVFACQRCGLTRASGPPFDVHKATKAVWCTTCRQA